MRETWYKLENGAVADPAEIRSDEKGRLFHSSGIAVAMRGDVPFSVGVDPDVERSRKGPAAKTVKTPDPAPVAIQPDLSPDQPADEPAEPETTATEPAGKPPEPAPVPAEPAAVPASQNNVARAARRNRGRAGN